MQTHDTRTPSARPAVQRPIAAQDAAALAAKIDALTAQVAYLVERQKKQEELLAEAMPILKEVMATATTTLDGLDKKGYFAFGREAVKVGQRIVESYSADDVQKFGDAIVSILDTVRSLTQPEVLAVMSEAGKVLENTDKVQPLGLVGMVRSTSNEEVQKGMAVMLEVLRHVGRASKGFSERQRPALPADTRKAKLAEALGPRRKKPVTDRPAAAPACAVPRAPQPVATVIDGIAFTADGHLADPKAWSPELGRTIAAAQGVELTHTHWQIVELARHDFEETGVSPNIRRLTQTSSMTTKDLYTLFPKAPARTIARIAGLPKPAGCL